MIRTYLIPILILVGVAATSAEAGISESGGTGILDVDTPETLPGGRLALSASPRYGYLSLADSRLHTVVGNLGVTLGLPGGFEAAAVLPLHAYFRTDTGSGAGALFQEDFSFRRRDLELKLRKAFPIGGERLRFALQAIGSAPIGSDRVEEVYAPGDSLRPFTSDAWNYGAVALTSLDFTGPTGNAPVRLHLNAGYYLNRNETEYTYRTAFRYPLPLPAPESSRDNDLMLLGAGLEFPLGRLSAFGELTTEQLVNRRDLVKFAENPIDVSAGLRFLFPGSVGLTTGITLDLSHDDRATAFDPGTVYPDWELRAALSLGDVLQSRRQRLLRKQREGIAATAPVAADTATTMAAADTVTTMAAADTAAILAGGAETAPAGEPPLQGAGADTTANAGPAAVTPPGPAAEPVAGPESGLSDSRPSPEEGALRAAGAAPDTVTAAAVAATVDTGVARRPAAPADTLGVRSSAAVSAVPPETGPVPVAAGLLDSDGDGIPDRSDACPLLAEDPDGFKDTDGCPDRDNDQDGFLDVDDPCPNAAEDYRGPHPNDGCPTVEGPTPVAVDWDRMREELTLALDRAVREAQPTPPPVIRVDPGPSPDVSSARSLSQLADAQAALTRELRDLADALRRNQSAAAPPPALAGPTGLDPRADHDGDGVSDVYDRCPDVPEDLDGWQDADGCPDLDNDGDGIRDLVDRCPNAPETWNGYQDDDGCPDSVPGASSEAAPAPMPSRAASDTLAAPAASALAAPAAPVAPVTVHFDSGTAKLTSLAQGQLDDLASDLLQRPPGTVSIEGYSDASGAPRANERLSAARAGAVRDYLQETGASRHRLVLVVRGAADPIGDNSTPEGRAQNRRVVVTFAPGGTPGDGDRR